MRLRMKQSLLILRFSRQILIIVLACALMRSAADGFDREFTRFTDKVSIENFGQVNDHIYRGGQPTGDDFKILNKLGVKTILDLRADTEPTSKTDAEQAGFRYINLPLKPRE